MIISEKPAGMSNLITGCCAAIMGPCTQLPQYLTTIKKQLLYYVRRLL